jgi:predicted Zn-dependent protease
MLLSESEAKSLCTKVLGYVSAEDAEVILRGETYSHLRFAVNAFSTSGYREDLNLSVTVWMGRRKGTATTNEVDDASLRAAVRQAEALAMVSPLDEEYVPTLGPQEYRPVAGFVESTLNLGLDDRARALAAIIGECDKSRVTGAGFHQTRGAAVAGATKHGNFRYERSTLASLSVTARTLEGRGSGYFLRNHFDVKLLDTGRVGREAVAKALTSRNPRPMDPGAYPVILEPQAVADLLGYSDSAFDARLAEEGRSAFAAPGGATRIGQPVIDERLSLYSDPWHPDLPGPAAAQDGIPAQKLHLIRNGVLENLVYSRFWAGKKGKQPTPGPVNTILEGNAPPRSVDEMIAATEHGLLVGRFWYLRTVDPRTLTLTGLTRDGVWYVEKGKVQYPVRNFRFNQSILGMLAAGNVELIGIPERVSSTESQGLNALLLPALKVKAFHFTSTSEAV